MKGLLEIKNITGSVKDIDIKKRVVTGYLSSFGNKDHDGDIIEKGAYSKSISERKNDIYFLNQHNWSQPHGKFDVLLEDTKGLYFESTPFVEGVTYSEDVLKLYDAGVLKEHSVGFVTVKSLFDNKQDARIIKEIKLYEGSVVTLGANSNTPFTGMKSRTVEDINNDCTLLYKAIRNGSFTDETFTMLEYALKDLQLQAYELGKKALIKEPLENTQKTKEPLIIDTLDKFINSLN